MPGYFSEWRKLPVSLSELCINTTLQCGQSFRWQRFEDDEWRCVLQNRILSLRQDSTHLHYRTYKPTTEELSEPLSSLGTVQGDNHDDTEALIRHYFNLDINLGALYEQWSAADPNFRKKASQFTGVRILRQDAWEALISFICSSNNNISRISQMVQNLCIKYGHRVGHVDGKTYYSFPTPEKLAQEKVESRLEGIGFGYRAKYIYKTAVMIAKQKGGEPWLNSLRNPSVPEFSRSYGDDLQITLVKPLEGVSGWSRPSYRLAHNNLLGLHGVGPKVADCVCLMGLGWGEAVPVDTHVWKIAQRDYGFNKATTKSLTKWTYDAIGDHFRKLWGEDAGWAHSVLFTADLRAFSDRLEDTKGKGKGKEKDKVEGNETSLSKVVETPKKNKPSNDEPTTTVQIEKEASVKQIEYEVGESPPIDSIKSSPEEDKINDSSRQDEAGNEVGPKAKKTRISNDDELSTTDKNEKETSGKISDKSPNDPTKSRSTEPRVKSSSSQDEVGEKAEIKERKPSSKVELSRNRKPADPEIEKEALKNRVKPNEPRTPRKSENTVNNRHRQSSAPKKSEIKEEKTPDRSKTPNSVPHTPKVKRDTPAPTSRQRARSKSGDKTPNPNSDSITRSKSVENRVRSTSRKPTTPKVKAQEKVSIKTEEVDIEVRGGRPVTKKPNASPGVKREAPGGEDLGTPKKARRRGR